MLHTVSVALSPIHVATVTTSEAGIQGLHLRTTHFQENGLTIELNRFQVTALIDLLLAAREATDRGRLLEVEVITIGVTADDLIIKRAEAFQLPF